MKHERLARNKNSNKKTKTAAAGAGADDDDEIMIKTDIEWERMNTKKVVAL